jgi:hypothetical protein
MAFYYPGFLFAFAALSIPIIIHLFSLRRHERLYFTNTRLLEKVDTKTKTQNRIKHLLILLSRLLFLSFLILAFAQPYLKVQDELLASGSTTGIVLDNSFSMSAESSEGILIDESREKALATVNSFPSAQSFLISSNEREISSGNSMSKKETLFRISSSDLTSNTEQINVLINRQINVFREKEIDKASIFVFSDFQKSTTKLAQIDTTSSSLIFVRTTPELVSNISMDSVWLVKPAVRPGEEITLRYRITSYEDDVLTNIGLTFILNDEIKMRKGITINPGQSVDSSLTFTLAEPGFYKGEMHIDDGTIAFDDSYFFSLSLKDGIHVAEITDDSKNNFISKAFSTEPYFRFIKYSNQSIDVDNLGKNQLIILTNLKNISSGLSSILESYIASGGNVIIFPNQKSLDDLNGFLNRLSSISLGKTNRDSTLINQLASSDQVFDKVFEGTLENADFPISLKRFDIVERGLSRMQWLLRNEAGNDIFVKFPYGTGNIFLASFPLDEKWNTLPRHGLFVPLIFQIAYQQSLKEPTGYALNNITMMPVKKNWVSEDIPLHLINEMLNVDVIPEVTTIDQKKYIRIPESINRAGIYRIERQGEIVGQIALNYDRLESDPAVLSNEEILLRLDSLGIKNIEIITDKTSDIEQSIESLRSGIPLWKYCLIFALIFLAAEVLLIRFVNPKGI